MSILHNEAIRALDDLKDKLEGSRSIENLLRLFPLLLDDRRRFVLYLGAGCSASVRIENNKTWRAPNWRELLEKLSRKVERPDELGKTLEAGGYDTLHRAWFISAGFSSKATRDRRISEIVEPPEGKRVSPLFEQILNLRFTDIITTNYDTNLTYFLDECKREEEDERSGNERRRALFLKNYKVISDLDSLSESGSCTGDPRVVYLHGRVKGRGEIGSRNLVFDREDYAWLYASEAKLLDFASVLLGGSHTIYLGYSLLDPSFDFIESALLGRYGRNRPDSFAFVSNVAPQTFGRYSDEHKLHLIQVRDPGENLPSVLKSITTVVDYLKDAESRRIPSATTGDDYTSLYMDKALELYNEGKFEESWIESRGALASALFWSGESTISDDPISEPRARRLCQIRLRLALCHYKLRSIPEKRPTGVEGRAVERKGRQRSPARVDGKQHDLLMQASMDEADRILGLPEKNGWETKDAWTPFQSSLDILRARGRYYEGEYDVARRTYEEVLARGVRRAGDVFPESNGAPDRDGVLTSLRQAVCYYYAACQVSRIEYQTIDGAAPSDEAPRGGAREVMDEVARKRKESTGEMTAVEARIDELRDGLNLYIGDRDDAELRYYQKSLATIALIARWTAGRQALGVVPEVLPPLDLCSGESGRATTEQLLEGVRLLESDKKAGHEPSTRWIALRKRYLARGYGILWLIGGSGESKGSLVKAYQLLHEAEQETAGPGLEEQRTLNCLETARLNVVALTGERRRKSEYSSPLTCAASVHYLSEFFRLLGEFDEKVGNVRWLRTLGFRAAAYLGVVATEESLEEALRGGDPTSEFFQFMRSDRDVQRATVLEHYDSCAKKIGGGESLAERKALFDETYGRIADEMGPTGPE